MTEDIGRGIDAREAIEQDAGDSRDETGGAGLVAGTDGAAALIGQAVTTITQPAPGEVVTIAAAAGQRYVIAFDPEAAQATVQGNDLILVFPGDARIVFQNLGTVANEADPPVFEIAGQPIASAALFNQAQALAEGTLETAAAPSAAQGTGATHYDDDTGQVIDLLDPLGVLPGVERLFPLIDLFPTIVEGGLNNPPVDFDVDVTANFFENLPFTFAPGLGSPVFTGNVGEDFLFVADEGTNNIFKISLDGKRISIAVTEDEIADAISDSGFDLEESGVKVDGKGNIFFSTDNGDVEYVLVKLADTGEIKIVAEGSNDSDDLLFEFDPEDLVFGPGGTLFVLDDGNEDRIVRIDDPLGTPQISVVITRDQVETQLEAALSTDGGEGGSVDLDIDFDVSLAISLDGKTIYIPVNEGIEGIVAVDVATGTASLLTPFDNIFHDIDKFITLAPNGDIIVADEGAGTLYRVNKDTGEITLFLSEDDITAANGGESPDLEGGFAFDSAGNFYLAEEGDDNILMWPTLDSSSGEVVRGAGMILVLESQLEDVDGRGIDVDLEGGLTVGFAPLPADQFVVAYSGVREFDDYYGEVFTLVDTRQNGDGGLDIFARFVSPDGTPIGDEFQVNSPGFPGVTDLLPDVAALRGGGFVVTWTAVIGDLDGPALAALDGFDGLGGFGGFGGFGDFEGVVVLSRVFDGSGVPLGPEIPVASLDNPNDGLQFISKAAGLNNGSFVITWTDVREPDDEFDGDPFDSIDIFARLFTPSGVPMGDEFQVNTLDGIQAISDVAALEDGGFAVVFTAIDTSFDGGEGGIYDQLDQVDVYVRVFDADCNPRGDEILITTVHDGLQALVKVTGLQGGGFLATWTDVNIDADSPESGINVMARVFDADGAPVAGEFLITSGPAEIEILSSAVALPGGKFFVSWTEFGSIDGGEGGSQDSVEIFGRVFGADGAPVGPEFQISDGQDFDAFSAIGILSTQAALGGTVLVTWTQIVDGDMAVFGRLYGVSGTASGDATPLGDPFQINEDTDPALLSSVAALQTSFQGGYLYEFQVGEAEIVQDNIHGTDIEDGVTTQFFITTLPSDQDGNPSGLLLVDRNDDNVIEEIYGEGFTPLPAGGIPVVTGDSVFYLLPSGSFEVKPDQVTFNYFTIDTDSLDSLNDGPATITIDFPDDEPKLVFVSDDASVDEDDIVVDGGEGGSQDPQEPGSDFLGEFLDDEFGASGDPLDPWPSDAPAVTGGTIFADLGMDRPGTIAFSEANLAALEALGLTSSTHKDPDGDDLPLSYILGGDGRTLVGYVDVGDKDGVFDQVEGLEDASDDVVFVVTLAPTGSNTGEFTYTFKLFGSINHPVSTDGGEGVPNGMGENSIDLPFEFILSDIDGDDLTGTFNVEVVDDVPSIAANDFDHYGGSNSQPTDLVVQEETIDGGEGPAMAMTTATIVFGADGPEATQPGSDLYYGDAVSLALTGIKALADGPGDPSSDPDSPFTVPSGDGFTNLMSGGIPVQIRIEGPTRIVGFIEVQADNGGYEPSFVNGDVNGAHEEIVFEAFLDVSQGDLFGTDEAKFTYNLFRQLDHPDDAAVDGAEGGSGLGQTGGDDQIEFAFAVTVLDDDGDTATLDLTVRVDDDGPEIFRDTLAAVDEDGLAERDPPGDNQGIPGGPGDAPGEVTMVTGNLDADFGADGPGDIDFAALDGQLVYDENGDQVFSRGEEVVYKWDAASHTLSAVVEGADSGAGGDGFLITWTQRDGFGQGDDVEVLGQILDLNGLPVGPEITVNSTQPDHQFNADAATLAGGRIVTVWQDTAASSPVINAQLFSESGTPLGGELTLSTLAASFAGDVTATPLAGGGFAVTWQDGDLFARTFDIDGNPTGAVIPVSVPADGNPSEVDVTALADGGLVLTWVNAETANPFDRETFARVLDADGNPRTGVFTVNADPVDFQLLPDVTALTGGGFVVAWDDRSLSPSDHDIVMRVFGADGAPVTGDIPVTGNSEDQTRPGVAALPGGGFAVSWADEDDSQDNIKIQFFDAAGAAQTGVDTVNTSGGAQFFPEIHALADGDVLVTWRGNGDSDDDGLFARVFAPDGTPVSGEIQINEDPAGSLIETDLEIVALPDGGFVASWVDGNQDGILGRVFDSSGNALTGDFSVNTTSNGFQFGPAGTAPIELASGEADRVIFEVEITDVATGAFKVTLLDQVDHPDETTEDNLIVDLEYAITDFDGDKQLGILKLDIDDDSPVIDGGEGGTAMSVQEEQIVDTADATVTYAFGADGPNDQTPIMIGLGSLEKVDEDGTEGGDMVLGGLTSDGRDVTIVNLDDVTIRGFVTLPGDSDVPEQDIFTATLDPVSGQFVFTLKGPIDHPDLGESGSDDQIRIQFDVTVKDFDGDTDTVVLSVTVDDDQPSLDNIALTHDETPGVDNPDDVDPATKSPGLQAALLGIFGEGAGFDGGEGNGESEGVPEELGVALNSLDFDYGADGPGRLIGLDPVVDGTDSGLFDTATGEAIYLYNGPDSTVVGVTFEDGIGDPEAIDLNAIRDSGGAVAFVAFMEPTSDASGLPDNASSADLWFVQYRAIQHDNPADHDEANPEPDGFDDEFLTLGYSVMDNDGDVVSGTATITIEDDGPTATDDVPVYLDGAEGGLADFDGAEGGFAGGNVLDNGDDPGVDGTVDGDPLAVISFTYTGEGLLDDAVAVTAAAGSTVETFAGGELTVFADGEWEYEIGFGDGNSAAGYVDDFSYTIQDGDGDIDSATQPIRVALEPDVKILDGVGDIAGGADDDFLAGGDAANEISGLGGNDLLFGGGGDDTLIGGTGDDQMFGDDGDDMLNGDAGDDRLNGGTGDDDLTGDDGADIFGFTLTTHEGTDDITDFSTLEGDQLAFNDVVDLGSDGIDINDAVADFIPGDGAGAVDMIVLTSGTTINVTDVDDSLDDINDVFANSIINGA